MISYTFSKREKALIGLLVVIALFIAWFVFVYQSATNEITRLESEIASTQSTISYEKSRLAQMSKMQKEIEERKEQGVEPKVVPAYDNIQPLMNELNSILSATQNYSLSFNAVSVGENYVNRGVSISFRTDTYDTAREVINSLAYGMFPCVIDSLSISASGGVGGTRSILGLMTYTSDEAGSCSASVHVTFFERVVK